jgi:hypothetical protein
LWLLFWLATRALRRWAAPNGVDDAPTPLERWADLATLRLRQLTSAVTLIIAVLIMLHGVGIRALPRFDWPDVVDWIRGSALPLLFIFGSAYVLIRATAMGTRNLDRCWCRRSCRWPNEWTGANASTHAAGCCAGRSPPWCWPSPA